MPIPAKITAPLRRLQALESESGRLAEALTPFEKRVEIERLRSILPTAILGHYDGMLRSGRAGIVPVQNGACSACHRQLPSVYLAHLQSGQDLEVCDRCSAFIYLPDENSDGEGM